MNYDKETIKDIQAKVGATADGSWGPATVTAIAAWHAKYNPDGSLPYQEFMELWNSSPHGCSPPSELDLYDVRRFIAADPERPYLIDVSSWQRVIDFEKVKAAGVSGVIIRSTLGINSEDKLWKENWDNASKAGLPVGFYHLAYPTLNGKKTDPVAAAHNVKRKALAHNSKGPELGFWCDLETGGGSTDKDGTIHKSVELHGVEYTADWIERWHEAFEGDDRGNYWSNRVFRDGGKLTRNGVNHIVSMKSTRTWCAAYPYSPPRDPLPIMATPWNQPSDWPWTMWQFTSSGRCPGVEAKGDGMTNVDVIVFNGGHLAFRKEFNL